jgi:hypothetical protein
MVCGVHGRSMWNGSLWNAATRAHTPEPFMSPGHGRFVAASHMTRSGKKEIKRNSGVGQDNGQDQGTSGKEGLPVDARQVRVERIQGVTICGGARKILA